MRGWRVGEVVCCLCLVTSVACGRFGYEDAAGAGIAEGGGGEGNGNPDSGPAGSMAQPLFAPCTGTCDPD